MPTSPPRLSAVLAATAITLSALSLAACSGKPDEKAQAAATTPANITLTADQLQHVKLFAVAPTSFHKTVEAAGVVDFDNDQATSVLSPISGPVTRLLVEPGQKVAQGQALAMVDSPDFAATLGAYAKALATAKTNRQIAEAMFLAEKTVKNYVSNLLTKLGMERRTQAAAYATRIYERSERDRRTDSTGT